MNIKDQNADTIYNIQGDFYLQNTPEVVKLLNQQKQVELKALHSISFFNVLSKEYSKKNLISRNTLAQKIKDVLVESNQLMIYGEPGIGKTTILYQLFQNLQPVVYISVKDKSPISIVSYIVNKIRVANNEDLLEIKEIGDAIGRLQSELQKTSLHFIFDDCEQSIEIVKSIIEIEKFDNTFLYATRNKLLFETENIKTLPCEPFSEDEVRNFVKTNNIELGFVDFNEIYSASCGNPLYLFYFSKYQINPLPKDIANYQNAIWNRLSLPEQEILIFTSIPYFKINIDELSEIIFSGSVLDCAYKIDQLSSLIKNTEGVLEIFHPSFGEFIGETLRKKGILSSYQEKLGNYYLSKNEIVQATYLLVDVAPSKVNKYLFDVFPGLITEGELEFALKVVNAKLNFVKKDKEKGYLYYHLCHIHFLLGNKDESTSSIDKSLEYLKKTKDKKFYTAALMFKAMNLIEQGEVPKAVAIADEVRAELYNFDEHFRAAILVNLSNIYINLSEFEKGAKACKEAFDVFEKEGFVEGMISSLINLVTSLSQIDEYRDDAEKYGLKLLSVMEKSSEFTSKVIVLNSLASIYREKKDYPKAKSYSLKAIKLCQKYKLKHKVVLNLINYGNVIRDEGNLPEAIKIYNEALVYAKDYKLEKEEARIYWIFAGIYGEKDNVENLNLSIEYADKSISLCKQINFYYGVAHAYEKKSTVLLLKDQSVEAAIALEESANYFQKIDHYIESYQINLSKAISLYTQAGQQAKANELLNKLIECTYKDIDNGRIIDLILDQSEASAVSSNFDKLFEKYFCSVVYNINIVRQFLSYIDYCKNLGPENGKNQFLKTIKLIVNSLGRSKYSHSIFGIAIEQSEWLLDNKDLVEISKSLQETLPLFFFREINDELVIVTSIADLINLEFHLFDDEPTCHKLALALILLLSESPELILDRNESLLEKQCVLWIHIYSEAYRKSIGDYIPNGSNPFKEGFQSVHMGKRDYKIQEMLLVSNEYEKHCMLNSNAEKKVSLYFFVNAIMNIKNHFYHTDIQENKPQRRFILNSVASLLGYTRIKDENLSNLKSEFQINIDKVGI